MDLKLSPSDFGDDFVWGVATSAFQTEGAHNLYGKGPSIWDMFSDKKGAIYMGDNAEKTCDFYHRYEDDIILMKIMNIPNFRFSLSWSRLLPEGYGLANPGGINFYNRIIDCCLENGIEPWITLYHWDLPQVLEDKGGWTNRNMLYWFEEYVQLCARCFGDRVKHWMVLNEPMVFTGAGYFLGVHAPGRKGLKNFLPAAHHAVLCQARGGKVLRSAVQHAKKGTTFSCSMITPYSNSQKDIKAAKRADALLNRLFVEPSLGLGYPIETLPVLDRMKRYIQPRDIVDSIFDFDFIGIQGYTREVIKHSYLVPYLKAKIIDASKRKVTTTLMDWEVYPPSIYEMISKFSSYKGIKKIIISENGSAFEDTLEGGVVQDHDRLSYLQKHIQQVYKAKREGFKINGYFVWSFTDNFEWAQGYYPRFGLVYVDFKNLKRTIKDSGKWYSAFFK